MIRGRIIGIISLIMAVTLPLVSYERNSYQEVITRKEVDNYLVKTTDINNNKIKTIKEPEKYDYIAVLEIPAIDLKRGIVSKNNPYNDIEYNIQILADSSMPDIINGNLLLAAHSGSSGVSFFKNLDKLKKDDIILLYYNGYKYIYSLSTNYIVYKADVINITRDMSKNTITLITCKNNSNSEQVVYIGYLSYKEEY